MGWMRSIRAGVRALFDKKSRNREIEDELDSYMHEWKEERVRQGMCVQDAARAASARGEA